MTDGETPGLHLRLIGIGAGTLDQLTGAAREALVGCDLVIAAAKRDDDPLLELRRALCAEAGVELIAVPDPERDRTGPDGAGPSDYPGAVKDWHEARVAAYAEVLRITESSRVTQRVVTSYPASRHDLPSESSRVTRRVGASYPASRHEFTVGFLVWGDPSLYDSTIRIVRSLAEQIDLTWDVIPGIAAPQLLAAAHRIVLHEVGRPVLITTGRRLLDDAAEHHNLVVMLDGSLTVANLPTPDAWQIWWGANLGTPSQRLLAGRLGQAMPKIRAARTAAKGEVGWVMDTYLVRRIG